MIATQDQLIAAINLIEAQKNEIASLKAEIKEAARSLARQQYDDLLLLGERDEKIRHLENTLAAHKENEDSLKAEIKRLDTVTMELSRL